MHSKSNNQSKVIEHIPYEYTDEVVRFESKLTYDTVRKAVEKYVSPGGKILDVGCGRGEMMKILTASGYRISGCDFDEECLRISSQYGEVMKLSIADIGRTEFKEKFDCIILSHVLEHVDNPRQTILELAKISKGLIVVSVPNPYYFIFILRSLVQKKPVFMNTGHLQVWDWSHFKTFIEVGCDMQVVEYFYDSVPLPIPHWIRKLLNRANLLSPIEAKILRMVLPRFCRSITCAIRTGEG